MKKEDSMSPLLLYIKKLNNFNIIIYMLIPELKELNCSSRLKSRYIEIHYPEFYKYLMKTYKDYHYKRFSELLYCYYNNIKEHPKCPICGKETKFLYISFGYQKFCGNKCSMASEDTQNKLKNTCLERFGVEHAAQNESIKKKIVDNAITKYGGMGNASESSLKKYQETCLERYGDTSPSRTEIIKNKIIQNTIFKHGGMGNGSPKSFAKFKQSCLEKYGDENPMHITEIKLKLKKTNNEKLLKNNENILNVEEIEGSRIYTCKCPHPECNKCSEKTYKIESHRYWGRRYNNTEPCTNLIPHRQVFSSGTSIELFVQSILDEYNIQYETNNRTLISPKELDIYIPSKNLAIECNGVFWHSLKKKPSNYHIKKFQECQEKDVQLITLWEDWIRNKPNIVKSILLSKLGLIKDKIYARKCVIKDVSYNDSVKFLEENHIQGKTGSSIRYGLYYNNELVSLMTFGKQKGGQGPKGKKSWELSRFCNKLNTNIIGGASKLFKHFLKEHPNENVISYSSNDISNGHLYKTLGFQSDKKPIKIYWYVHKISYDRVHRSVFMKNNIVRMGLKESNDSSWTEREVTYELGFLPLYDSGLTKWVYKDYYN